MQYLIPTFVLALVPAGFFLRAKGRFRQFGKLQYVLRVVVALPLVLSGLGHFFFTAVYAGIIPPMFSHPNFWVVLTGIFELAGAVGLVLKGTSKPAAACLAVLMIAVFPANVYAANRTVGGLHMPGVPMRLAMQIVYIFLLLLAGWGIPDKARAK